MRGNAKTTTVRVAAAAVCAMLFTLLVLLVQNPGMVRIAVLDRTCELPLALVMLGAWALGFGAGWVFHVAHHGERRRTWG